MEVMIHAQDDDNEYFRWFLVRYLHPVNKNPAKLRSDDKEFVKQFDFKS